MRGSKCFLLLTLAAVLLCIHGAPQMNPDKEKLLQEIFKMPATGGQGFNKIVTSDPIDPSKPPPQFNSVSGKECNCVPYHLCNSTSSGNEVAEDGSFDGFGLINIRFNPDDPVCSHYLEVCCGRKETQSTSLMPRPVTRSTGCGVRNVGGIDFNITNANDNEAGFGEYPWTVALLHAGNNSYFCAGSLIHPQVVLTAVHCVIGRAPNSFKVRAGEWDTQTELERLPYEELGVQRVITHPQYNPRNVANDFALVILNDKFTLDEHINTICLPSQNAIPAEGTPCLAAGWGKDIFGQEGRWSVIMKSVPLPIVEFNNCWSQLRRTRLGPKFALDRSFICAGGEVGFDTCEGDGGAPLVCPIGTGADNRYHQSGIVAWGIGCKSNVPAAYASVAMAREWIDQQMLGNGFSTTSYSAV